MKNNLCGGCGGRGFHWKPGEIISRATGATIAATFMRGDTCEFCRGTGKRGLQLRHYVFYAGVAALLSYFIIYPLIRLWLD